MTIRQPTIEQLAEWLEEDGHPGCAGELLTCEPEHQAQAARSAADCAENDPDRYDDGFARALPGELREWAANQDRGVIKTVTYLNGYPCTLYVRKGMPVKTRLPH